MSLLSLFSLSNELLIQIISNLRPVDIYACRCTCRKLNRVIINSHLIQYLMRTALSGVFDPLEPGLSLPERLDVLERWETAWMEMDLREPNAVIDAPVPARSILMPARGFFLSGQYLIMSHEKLSASAFYSFLDIHARSSHTNAARWTTIKIDTPILTFGFASELNLAVAISEPTFIHHRKATVTIRPLEFSTGEPHPLASQPELEVSVAGSDGYTLSETTVIGDYILYWVGVPHHTVLDSLCHIYLVAWKEGWVSELCTSLPGVYSSSLSVLSEEIILLVRPREPALELCRLSNINDREKASLETVCILSLPVLSASASLLSAVCFNEHPGHGLFSKNDQQHASLHPQPLLSSSSGQSTQQLEGSIDTRHHLHSVPVDGIVVVRMNFNKLSGFYRVFDLTVRRRTLLEFADAQAQAGAAGTGMGMGMGMVLVVPWEKWGPNKAHILRHDSFMGSLAGERRATVVQTHITIRDYNPFRVQRALDLFGGAEKEVKLECGSVVKVVKEKVVYRGGDCFCFDIETSLPYVETVAPYDWFDNILMDKDNLVVARMELTEAGDTTYMKFYLHSL